MVNNILQTYYLGVLKRLRAEVDLLNQIIPHAVTKGSENEESLKNVIKNFIPHKYSIGSGIVIDSFGNKSKQIDLIVYDSHIYPNLFSQSSTTLFPVETVIACIEVKTLLNGTNLKEEVFENTKSIRQLKHYVDQITINKPDADNPVHCVTYQTMPPLSVLFAFRVDSQDPITWKNRFCDCHDFQECTPDISLLLDIATGFKFPNVSNKTKEQFESLTFQVRECDVKCNGSVDVAIFNSEPEQMLTIDQNIYKSSKSKLGEIYPVLMPERAFLNFLILLNKALDVYPKHSVFEPEKYLDDKYAHGLYFDKIQQVIKK